VDEIVRAGRWAHSDTRRGASTGGRVGRQLAELTLTRPDVSSRALRKFRKMAIFDIQG